MTSADNTGGDNGEVNYGWDYWFNWSIRTAPAALQNTHVAALAKPGSLVIRILEAGKSAQGRSFREAARRSAEARGLTIRTFSPPSLCAPAASELDHALAARWISSRWG